MFKKAFQTSLCSLALGTSLLVPLAMQARQDDKTSSADNTRQNKGDQNSSQPQRIKRLMEHRTLR